MIDEMVKIFHCDLFHDFSVSQQKQRSQKHEKSDDSIDKKNYNFTVKQYFNKTHFSSGNFLITVSNTETPFSRPFNNPIMLPTKNFG
jgi:hypothetical protein